MVTDWDKEVDWVMRGARCPVVERWPGTKCGAQLVMVNTQIVECPVHGVIE